MKRIPALLTLLALALFALWITGCTAAQIASTDAAIGGTPLQPTTIPGTQPGQVISVAPTTQAQVENLVKTVVADAAPVAAAAAFPWGGIAVAALSVLSGVLGVVTVKQTSKLATTNAIIAAAAPGTAQLVQQVTDNQTLATDVTKLSQVAPGVIALLQHPSAASVLQATGTVVNAIAPTA